MQMDDGIDTGDMLVVKPVDIAFDDTGETLHDKLAKAGADAIRETICQLENGTLDPKKQNDALSCYAPMISKDTGVLDFNKDALSLYNLVRGLNSYPYASTFYNGHRFKVIRALPIHENSSGANGEILSVTKDGILVKCESGALLICEVQFEGKKKMPVSEYIKGNKIETGIILGG